jgi:hypothetical protein
MEDKEINPCIYSHVTVNKGPKNMHWRKDKLFNKWCWESWISTCRRLEQGPCLSPWRKINSKWIKDFNVRSESLKLLEENTETLQDVGIGNDFLSRTPIAQKLGARIDKKEYIKLKSFCREKETTVKRQPTEWEKMFTAIHMTRISIQNIWRIQRIKYQKKIIQKQWTNEQNRHFSK